MSAAASPPAARSRPGGTPRVPGAARPRGTQKQGGGTLRIHQSVARDLGSAILTGVYAPGDNLGREMERSRELGVSRTAYREAIRILIAKGLVHSRPKAGTHVNPRDRWNLLDEDVLAWMFADEPDETFLHELQELRYIIEPPAAYLAAHRRSDDQVAEMRAALEAMRAHGLGGMIGQAADRRFHQLLLAAAGNSAVSTLSDSIGSAVQWTTEYKQRHQVEPRDSLGDHERVLLAIEARAPDRALRAMRRLLRRTAIDLGLEVDRTF